MGIMIGPGFYWLWMTGGRGNVTFGLTTKDLTFITPPQSQPKLPLVPFKQRSNIEAALSLHPYKENQVNQGNTTASFRVAFQSLWTSDDIPEGKTPCFLLWDCTHSPLISEFTTFRRESHPSYIMKKGRERSSWRIAKGRWGGIESVHWHLC